MSEFRKPGAHRSRSALSTAFSGAKQQAPHYGSPGDTQAYSHRRAMADSFFLLALPHHEARAPAGLEHPAATAYDDLDSKGRARAGRAVESLLTRWASAPAPAGAAAPPRAHRLGDGGYVLAPSPYCRAAARGSVVALLSGEISATPGHDLLAEAHSAWMAPSAPGVEAGDDAGAEALLALTDVSPAASLSCQPKQKTSWKPPTHPTTQPTTH